MRIRVVLAITLSLAGGFWVGHEYPTKPAHHYVQYMQSPYMVDPETGKVCDPMPGGQPPMLSPADKAWQDAALEMGVSPKKVIPSCE